MIGHELLPDAGILVVSPVAPLEAADFEELTEEVDGYMKDNGDLRGIIIEAASFPWWHDLAAVKAHYRFIREHHSHVRRVAAITDGGFLSIMPSIARLFVNAEVRHFSTEERQAAYDWINEGYSADYAAPVIG